MTFPDRIERTIQLAHPPERVWAALTTAEGLGTWFGQRAEIDLRVGGQAKLTWDSGDTATLTIERLEPPRVFGFTWPIYGLPEGDPRRTYVEFTLEPAGAGTALTVVESGFAQLQDAEAHKVAYSGNTKGWTNELGELVAYLDGQA
ncbi:SRPBCC domain-containing protein [Thermoactinospora rubra]|uniref:SRPBCC domain-containing protein n=1 Tax=Thermoactinospora rubra TaxID=1088767 RepID=UPI000A121391|nr:SRPBCC domain-containing protein [Thermoactinospora rubra]